MAMRWYVVHAYSQYENNVLRALKERITRAGLEEKFGDILVPTEEVVEIRDGQKRTTERKFYPGYVLVQMEMSEDTWHLVKSTPKVLGFIGGTPDKPAPISEKEANAILSPGRGSGRKAEAEDALRAGRSRPDHRRPVRGLLGCGRGSQLRQEPSARRRADLRSRHACGTGIFAGAERLNQPAFREPRLAKPMSALP